MLHRFKKVPARQCRLTGTETSRLSLFILDSFICREPQLLLRQHILTNGSNLEYKTYMKIEKERSLPSLVIVLHFLMKVNLFIL